MRNKALALRVLKTTKRKAVLKDLRRKFLYREDAYPKDLAEAQEMLNHYVITNNITEGKRNPRKSKETNGKPNVIQGVQYLQSDDGTKGLTPGTDKITHEVRCYECGKMGNYAAQCPEGTETRRSQITKKRIMRTTSRSIRKPNRKKSRL